MTTPFPIFREETTCPLQIKESIRQVLQNYPHLCNRLFQISSLQVNQMTVTTRDTFYFNDATASQGPPYEFFDNAVFTIKRSVIEELELTNVGVEDIVVNLVLKADEKDIKFGGNGKPVGEGNKRYRAEIISSAPDYVGGNAKKNQVANNKVANAIYEKLTKEGRRFLHKENGQYVETKREVALTKIKQALRAEKLKDSQTSKRDNESTPDVRSPKRRCNQNKLQSGDPNSVIYIYPNSINRRTNYLEIFSQDGNIYVVPFPQHTSSQATNWFLDTLRHCLSAYLAGNNFVRTIIINGIFQEIQQKSYQMIYLFLYGDNTPEAVVAVNNEEEIRRAIICSFEALQNLDGGDGGDNRGDDDDDDDDGNDDDGNDGNDGEDDGEDNDDDDSSNNDADDGGSGRDYSSHDGSSNEGWINIQGKNSNEIQDRSSKLALDEPDEETRHSEGMSSSKPSFHLQQSITKASCKYRDEDIVLDDPTHPGTNFFNGLIGNLKDLHADTSATNEKSLEQMVAECYDNFKKEYSQGGDAVPKKKSNKSNNVEDQMNGLELNCSIKEGSIKYGHKDIVLDDPTHPGTIFLNDLIDDLKDVYADASTENEDSLEQLVAESYDKCIKKDEQYGATSALLDNRESTFQSDVDNHRDNYRKGGDNDVNGSHKEEMIQEGEEEEQIVLESRGTASEQNGDSDDFAYHLANEHDAGRTVYNHEGRFQSDDDIDNHTLMATKAIFTKSWWFGFLIYTVQVAILSMIFLDQLQPSIENTLSDIPFKVTWDVRASQFLVIFISVIFSHDLFMAIKDIRILWYSNREWIKGIDSSSDGGYPSLRNINMRNDSLRQPMKGKIFCMLQLLLPSVLKFVQGLLVLLTTFVIVIQADDTIELFKAFGAIQFISDFDDVAFQLSCHEYFGSTLKSDSNESKKIKVTDRTILLFGLPLRPLVLAVLFVTTISAFFGAAVIPQNSLSLFQQKYPNCGIKDSENIANIANGDCNGGIVNTVECGFDGGDCVNFNLAYPQCTSLRAYEVGDGTCQDEHNVEQCGFDGGDCCQIDENNPYLGDGQCHGGFYNTKACGHDSGACDKFNRNHPYCSEIHSFLNRTDGTPIALGDGVCDFIPEYMTEECGFEFGDCTGCDVLDPKKLGDGNCDGGKYNTEACGFDKGDCLGLLRVDLPTNNLKLGIV